MRHILYIITGIVFIGAIIGLSYGVGTLIAMALSFLVQSFKVALLTVVSAVLLFLSYKVGKGLIQQIKGGN